MNYDKFLQMADEQALNSPFKTKMGAIIVRRSKILSCGCSDCSSNIPNRLFRTHPRSSKWCAIHAEMAALRGALYRDVNVKGADIIVSGWTTGGNRPVSCRPCRSCVQVLKEWGLRRVVFRLPDGFQVLKINDIDDTLPVCSSCDQSIYSWSRDKSDSNHK